MLVVVLQAQLPVQVPVVRQVTSCATDRAPGSCQQDRVLETDQVPDVPVQVDQVTDRAVIDWKDLAVVIDQGESRRQVVHSINNVVKRCGQTSGGRFTHTPHDCQPSVHAFGAAIRIGVGNGPATAVIGGAGPRGQP